MMSDNKILYWDFRTREYKKLGDYTNEELDDIFRSRYSRCAKEYRMNKILYTVAQEVYNELEDRGYNMDALDKYRQKRSDEENEEIERQLDIMYEQVEPVA